MNNITDVTGEVVSIQELISRLSFRQGSRVRFASVKVNTELNLFICRAHHVREIQRLPSGRCEVVTDMGLCGADWVFQIKEGLLYHVAGRKLVRQITSRGLGRKRKG